MCEKCLSTLEHAPRLREYGKKIFYVHCSVVINKKLCFAEKLAS